MQWGLVLFVKNEQEDMVEIAQLISGRVGMSSSSYFMHQLEKGTFFKIFIRLL